ncbi:MAG: deoxyribonuclease IV [Bacilli bacterium]
MLIIGSHVSFNKDTQLLGSLNLALSYGENAFMFYTGAPQNSVRFPVQDSLTIEALEKMKETNIDYHNVIVHAPYIINLASTDKEKYKFAINFLQTELDRVRSLGIKYIVLHPGSHVGAGIEVGIRQIVNALNQLFFDKDNNVTILLETMAGKGTEVGSKLEELKKIIERVTDKSRIGVCLDTCHLNDAGYDMTEFEDFLDNFDKVIGLDYIHCIHINDSKNIIEAHKDRHENIGFGSLGFDNLCKIIYSERLTNIPKILETPYIDNIYPPYKEEITMIKNKKFDKEIKKKITG